MPFKFHSEFELGRPLPYISRMSMGLVTDGEKERIALELTDYASLSQLVKVPGKNNRE